jgi:hypothetical protein
MAREPKTKAPIVKGDYPVGYCKPPIEHQIKKGERRNAAGRPKRKPPETDLARLVAEELQREIEIQEGGKSRKVSKAALIATQLVNQGIKGDRKAVELAFKLMASAETSAGHDAGDLSPAMIASFLKRHGGGEASHD